MAATGGRTMARDDWTLTGLSYEQLSTEEIEWVPTEEILQ